MDGHDYNKCSGQNNFSQEDHWVSVMCVITMANFTQAKWLVSAPKYITEISQNTVLHNSIWNTTLEQNINVDYHQGISGINFSKNYKKIWMQSQKAIPPNCVEIKMDEITKLELNSNIFIISYGVCQNKIYYSVKSIIYFHISLMKQQKFFKFPMNLI